MSESGEMFLEESRRLLSDEYLPKLHRAVDRLPDGDLWWTPNEASNSAGTLLLHLRGNLGQWIVSGVGGEPDHRRRDREFAGPREASAGELLGLVDAAVAEAVAVLAGVSPARLTERVEVQGRETTILRAVYHAVEHFSTHTGQVLWIAKARGEADLELYRTDTAGHPRPTW